MMPPAHTIIIKPWRGGSFSERVVLDVATAMLWPLKPDERLTVLISLLAEAIDDVSETEDQIDAIVDVLRMQLKLGLHHEPQDRHDV
jgi:hypothetical protein